MIIAIDGTAASGKGTLGRTLAMQLQLDYLDTGKLYRAVGFIALEKKLDLELSDPTEIIRIAVNLDLSLPFGAELRTSEVGEAASKVAAFTEVRQALLRKQRDFAEHPPNKNGAILDGRDIGTVVVPGLMLNSLLTQQQIFGRRDDILNYPPPERRLVFQKCCQT